MRTSVESLRNASRTTGELRLYEPKALPFPRPKHGASPPQPCAIIAPPASELLEALSAGAQARGWSFTPISSELPAERIALELESFAPATIVHAGALAQDLDWAGTSYEAIRSTLREHFAFLIQVSRLLGPTSHAINRTLAVVIRADSVLQSIYPAALKCLAHERPELMVKPIVFHDLPSWSELADIVLEESGAPMPASVVGEVHFDGLQPLRPELCEVLQPTKKPFVDRSKGVVLVTGGARGILPGLLTELSAQGDWTLIVTGRTSSTLPEFSVEELADPPALRRRLAESEPSLSARQVAGRIEAARTQLEVVRGLARLREAARVQYLQCDVTDGPALEELISIVRSNYGEIRGVVHGAGKALNLSLERHTVDQFEEVVAVKAMPLAVFARALPLERPLFFFGVSSAAAVLGNSLQCSYSAANAMLNSFIEHHLRIHAPRVLAKALCYSAWDGGMVTDGLKAAMAERGLSCIDPERGNRTLVEQLEDTHDSRTLVYLTADPYFCEPIEREGRERAILKELDGHELVKQVVYLDSANEEIEIECAIPPSARNRLDDHRFGDTPVLPASMLLDMVSRIASVLRGREPSSLFDYRSRELVTLKATRETTLRFRFLARTDQESVLACKVFEREHHCADIELDYGNNLSCDEALEPLAPLSAPIWSWTQSRQPLYGEGGIDLGARYHALETVDAVSADGIEATCRFHEDRDPMESILEALTQANAAYCVFHHGSPSFPYRIQNLVFHRRPSPKERYRVLLRRSSFPSSPPLCSMQIRVFDNKGEVLLSGGPWSNFYEPRVATLMPGPGDSCCAVILQANLERHIKLLKRIGSSLNEVLSGPEDSLTDREEADSKLTELGRLSVILAAKESAAAWLRSRETRLAPRDIHVTLHADGEGLAEAGQAVCDNLAPELRSVSVVWRCAGGVSAAIVGREPTHLALALGGPDDPTGSIEAFEKSERELLAPLAILRGADFCLRLADTARRAALRLRPSETSSELPRFSAPVDQRTGEFEMRVGDRIFSLRFQNGLAGENGLLIVHGARRC